MSAPRSPRRSLVADWNAVRSAYGLRSSGLRIPAIFRNCEIIKAVLEFEVYEMLGVNRAPC